MFLKGRASCLSSEQTNQQKQDIQPLISCEDCVERGLRFLLGWWKRPSRDLTFWEFSGRITATPKLLMSCYCCSKESIFAYRLCVRFSGSTRARRTAIQRVINASRQNHRSPPPRRRFLCLRKAPSVLQDSSRPGHNLFEPFPSGRRFSLYVYIWLPRCTEQGQHCNLVVQITLPWQ